MMKKTQLPNGKTKLVLGSRSFIVKENDDLKENRLAKLLIRKTVLEGKLIELDKEIAQLQK